VRRTLLCLVKLRQYETPALEHAARADSVNGSLEPAVKSHSRWYLIQCKARQDERALENLQRQGFECYRPVYESERMHRGRKHLTSAALFPGYLFIRLDRINDNWLPIRSTRGVIQVVLYGSGNVKLAARLCCRERSVLKLLVGSAIRVKGFTADKRCINETALV
jgi:hypothetical protein